MSKRKITEFVCVECGSRNPKWLGRCPECGAWDTLLEERSARQGAGPAVSQAHVTPLGEVSTELSGRLGTGLGEMDRTLGGGVVPGQVVLLGGDPGVGKSTLMLQVSANMAGIGARALYVSGEESTAQIKMRSDRLGLSGERIDVLGETDAESIAEEIRAFGGSLAVVDSIQVLHSAGLEGAPGTLSQVRDSGALLVRSAKLAGIPVFIIGHVTKGGMIAGPRTLEHLVDTVLYFEGDRGTTLRMLRCVKNRFGPTDELGIFKMSGRGLEEVSDAGGLFLGRLDLAAPGGAIVASREGRRVLLIELQALVSETRYAVAVRRATGIDGNRVSMVLAVLERWGGLDFSGMDVFVNVTGGARISEPACDLGVALAAASSRLGRAVPPRTLVVGEVGLRGEIRPVPSLGARLSEAGKLGFERVVAPGDGTVEHDFEGMEVLRVENVCEALEILNR
jgi:DNA repair protein RadA/Sms